MRKFNTLSVLAMTMVMAGVQAQTGTITLPGKTERVSVLLHDFSQATGLKFEALGPIADDVIFSSSKERPIREVMDRLASVTGGEWSYVRDKWQITRTRIAEQLQAAKEVEVRTALYKAAMQKQRDELQKMGVFDAKKAQEMANEMRDQMEAMRNSNGPVQFSPESREKMRQLMAAAPASRIVGDLSQSIDPKEFASMEPGSRKVFAIRPTQMQKVLPGNAITTARTFIKDQEIYANAMGSLNAMGNGSRMMFTQGDRLNQEKPTGDVYNVLLVATRNGVGSNIDLTATVLNNKGEVLGMGFSGLQLADEILPGTTYKFESKTVLDLSKDEAFIAKAAAPQGGGNRTFRAVTIAVADGGPGGAAPAMISFGDDEDPAKTPDTEATLREKIIHPEEYDPLSFILPKVLGGLAGERQHDIMALVPDSALGAVNGVVKEDKLGLEAAVTALIQTGGVDFADRGDWIEAVPRFPQTARDSRSPRVPLGKALQLSDKLGLLSLDQRADYAAVAPMYRDRVPIDQTWMSMINAENARQISNTGFNENFMALRFYGQLSPQLREVLKNSGRINYGVMPQQAKETFKRIVYQSMDGPQLRGENQGASITLTGGPGGVFRMGGPEAERTTLLPNGIPNTAYVQARTNRQAAAMGRTADGGENILDARRVAMNNLASNGSMPNFGGMQPAGVAYTQFKPASMVQLTLMFDANPEYGLGRSITDYIFDASARYGSYADLPNAFKNDVTNIEKKMQDEMTQIGNRMGPGGGRPQKP